MTSQIGDRVIFERLATPRPAPKVTLKSNWRTRQQQQQQPQQSSLEDDVPSIWKQRATWESRAGVRDDTKHATEVERASRKLVQAASEPDADTHLTEIEALTDAFSNNEANIQKIKQIKIRRRTSSAILLIQLVTELNMVEFVFMDFELGEMTPAQLAGR